MKKIIVALLLGVSLFAGCQAEPGQTVTPNPYEGWNTYAAPQGAFTLRYPSDWTQTDAKDEVQFWDNLSDGKNSIKIILVQRETTQAEDETRETSESSINPTQTIRETQPINLNGKEVTITRGTSLNTPYQRYEYPFETFTLDITALFNDDTPELRELATKVQESINFTTQP